MRIPKSFKEEHEPEFRKRKVGFSPWGRRAPIYNYRVFCSCGWSDKSNMDREDSRISHRKHLEDAYNEDL